MLRTHTEEPTAQVWQHLLESGDAPACLSHVYMKLDQFKLGPAAADHGHQARCAR